MMYKSVGHYKEKLHPEMALLSIDDPYQYEAEFRNLCLNDLYFLIRYGFSRKDIESQWLLDRCIEVQNNPDNMLDLWSREHYKSTILTYALTIQNILNNPEITVGIFSHTRPIAKGFLRQIKREFELNDDLKRIFPDILYKNPGKEALKWSEDDGIIVKRKSNPKESTVEAWGVVDGQPTSKHYSLLVYDDIVTMGSVTTPEMIEKTTDSLALSYNLGAHGGKRRFIGTRYHFNDSYKTIIARGTAIPRIHAATHDGSDTGDAVFLTNEQLKNKRRDMGPYVYACQMLQNPAADSSQGFKREWLRFYEGQPPNCVWYLVVDAANGKRKGNDYTSIWAVGLGADGNYYAVPEVRDRLNLTERAQRVIQLHRKYNPVEVRYERYGIMADIVYITEIMEKEQYRFDIIEVAGPTSKTDRIKRLIPKFEGGSVYIPKSYIVTDYEGIARDNVQAFIEDEYAAFPVPVHDDMLDAFARIEEKEGYLNGKKIPLALKWPQARKKAKTIAAGGWMG